MSEKVLLPSNTLIHIEDLIDLNSESDNSSEENNLLTPSDPFVYDFNRLPDKPIPISTSFTSSFLYFRNSLKLSSCLMLCLVAIVSFFLGNYIQLSHGKPMLTLLSTSSSYTSVILPLFSSSFSLFSSVSSISSASNSLNINESDDSEGWEFAGELNGVKTYLKKIPGSKLHAFRGIAEVDLHISQCLGPFLNITHALEWCPTLKSVTRYPFLPNSTEVYSPYEMNCHEPDIIHQELNLPWPITPRDVLLKRYFVFDGNKRQVSVNYQSIDDDRFPIKEGIIRAISPYTRWRFTVLNNETTTSSSTIASTTSSTSSSIHKYTKPLTKFSSNTKQMLIQTMKVMKNIQQKWVLLFKQKITHWFGLWKISRKSSVHTSQPPLFEELSPEIEELTSSTPISTPISTPSTTPSATSSSLPSNIQHCPDFYRQNQLCISSSASTNVNKHKHNHLKAPRGRTLVEIEAVVDSKGSIPAWFINYMQRYWPSTTLNAFEQNIREKYIRPHPAVECW